MIEPGNTNACYYRDFMWGPVVDRGRVAELKRLLALAAIASVAGGLCACGGAGPRATVTKTVTGLDPDDAPTTISAPAPAPIPKADADRDNDIGAASDDTNNNRVLEFGHAASPPERRAVTALVRRYYSAALADDGARGCAMLYSTIAESAAEDSSREPGTPAYMQGLKTCAAVLGALFEHYHAQLAAELPKLEVTRVRLEQHHGFAFLSFGTVLPERRISVEREGHVWKMSQIFDEELP